MMEEPVKDDEITHTSEAVFGVGKNARVVTHVSHFVDNLSEVVKAMGISTAVPIRQGGRIALGNDHAFNARPFYDAGLNYFLGVRVVTGHTRPASTFSAGNALGGVNNANATLGDTFISGFVEGGMLSALVSIKIVDKEKQKEVVNAVDTILGVQCGAFRSPQDVDFATKALAELAEITIQLHSTGSAVPEPVGQPRTLDSLRDIASKFPARAAMNPERIAVILTKYESLQGYQALRSTGSITACYDHTSLYIDTLMDSFMEFQNFDRRLSAQLSDIKAGTKQFDVVDSYALALDIDSDHSRAQSRYESSWSGLARAKRECLIQMMKIVNEVEETRKNPSIATDIARIEGFQSPLEFNDRLPKVKEVAELRYPEKVCSQMKDLQLESIYV
ncbi:uncharacterized protein LTHEOB_6684 [Neofusicoccum parvum]|nr:uncharacterized protein LTHEOB_6684 [Neofusicoccum parvum]